MCVHTSAAAEAQNAVSRITEPILGTHMLREPLYPGLVDVHIRAAGREAEAPDVPRRRPPVDRLHHAPLRVRAELERERVRSAPVREAVEAGEAPVAGERRTVQRSDQTHDLAHP